MPMGNVELATLVAKLTPAQEAAIRSGRDGAPLAGRDVTGNRLHTLGLATPLTYNEGRYVRRLTDLGVRALGVLDRTDVPAEVTAEQVTAARSTAYNERCDARAAQDSESEYDWTIEVRSQQDYRIWQSVASGSSAARSPRDLAHNIAEHQNVTEGDDWRVRVTEPDSDKVLAEAGPDASDAPDRPVTHPYHDAPDGAIVHGWERSAYVWVRLPDSGARLIGDGVELPEGAVWFEHNGVKRPGYVAGRCGHAVAASEWRAGFRECERCA